MGASFYRGFLVNDYMHEIGESRTDDNEPAVLKPSKPGVIITIAREHGSSGKQIGKMTVQKLDVPFYYKEMILRNVSGRGFSQDLPSQADEVPERAGQGEVLAVNQDKLHGAGSFSY